MKKINPISFALPYPNYSGLDDLCSRYGYFIMKEIWKDVVGYEGFYQVSSHGNIKSLTRTVSHTKGSGSRNIKERILTPHTNNKGYLHVVLSKNGKTTSLRVHRLVGITFVSNPLNNPEVNHKDLNKLNNSADNLEWLTHHENILHAWESGKCIANKGMTGILGSDHASSKTVYQFTLDGRLIAEYGSTKEAFRKTGIGASYISAVCRGVYKKAKGYIWKYSKN